MADEHDNEPEERSGTIPPPSPDPERKRLFERAVPELVKRVLERAVESGVEKLSELSDRPESLRNLVGSLQLPKDVLADLYGQIDDTKNGLYRVVAKEIRDVLEQTHIADEIVKALTKLSFEIKTEIRFVPNDRAASEVDEEGRPKSEPGATGGEPKSPSASWRPKITSEVNVKDRSNSDRKK